MRMILGREVHDNDHWLDYRISLYGNTISGELKGYGWGVNNLPHNWLFLGLPKCTT